MNIIIMESIISSKAILFILYTKNILTKKMGPVSFIHYSKLESR